MKGLKPIPIKALWIPAIYRVTNIHMTADQKSCIIVTPTRLGYISSHEDVVSWGMLKKEYFTDPTTHRFVEFSFDKTCKSKVIAYIIGDGGE